MIRTISFTDYEGDKVSFERYPDNEIIISTSHGDESTAVLLEQAQLAALFRFLREDEELGSQSAARPGYIVRSED